MSTVGLDIGTSGCKAVAFDAEGQHLVTAGRSYPLYHPKSGWAELDAEEVWSHARACLQEVTTALPHDPVTGLGVCSQGEAFMAVDDKLQTLNRAMVSSDTRAAALAEAFRASHGTDFFYQRSGHTPHSVFSFFKLLWLKQHQPEIWRKAGKFLFFEDFIHAKLGVEPAVSWGLAGRSQLFNPQTKQWDADLLSLLELEPERLARPLASGELVGTVPNDVAKELGLAPGCRVVTCGHDQMAAALGAGVMQPGQSLYAMGTVECVVLATAEFAKDTNRQIQEANLCCYDHAVPGLYGLLAYNFTGANLISWCRREHFADYEDENAYPRMMGALPSEPSDLQVLPYWAHGGTPYFDTECLGAILGLGQQHTRMDVLKAVIEGLALEIRLNLDVLEAQGAKVDSFIATGGGTRSRELLQTKANVLQKPITPSAQSEGGCLAGALLARAQQEGIGITELADQWAEPGETVEPQAEWADRYAEKFARYRELYPALKPLMRA